jgi:thiosulfate/3-mercaptopyruvate sulfurtransferase
MSFTTLIDAWTLHEHLADADWVVVDCRFALADPPLGREQYLAAHIPGAVYAHLKDDLSSAPVTDNGRHPLPSPAQMATLFTRLGIGEMTQVVVYDANNGANAARLWWMLHYMGHTAVAVLDGGWQAWQAANFATQSGEETNKPALFTGSPNREMLVIVDDVLSQPLLVDSREPARYRGEEEPIDPAAGHIPGAVNYFYQRHWQDGRYRSPEQIRQDLQAVLGDVPPEQATFYCGSGVTACVNLLAMKHAGLGNGRLYVGSWSEWVSDPQRPQAQGDH